MNGQVRIEQMFVFIVIDDDGTEGIPAFNMNGMAMPLIGADMERIATLKPLAASMGKPCKLVRFSQREELETIEPERKERVDA